ncbi:hypothetical protein AEAC466_17465 [Asticcacaulis sp. AC466]|uniref:hypothetical protein n=1 Tax=Asticcacaulis sp. AC466 TaxID=1282362 RepID=UPI0003C41027|nr:hypothetical protein [Asticcacaulis sp. AC466]ESQ82410.1 hypothetical protein AEAC466_17465 [Asticcacaulis sp. AC466]
MSFRIDEMDWLTTFEVTCRRCRVTRMYQVRELLRMPYSDLYLGDLQHVLKCPRRCGGSQYVSMPGGGSLPEAPLEDRLDYGYVQAVRDRLTDWRLTFTPQRYLEFCSLNKVSCELRRNRDGEFVNRKLPIPTVTPNIVVKLRYPAGPFLDPTAVPVIVTDRAPGISLHGTMPNGHIREIVI